MELKTKNKVIIAPLNWGWGHVTRCIPIVKEIQRLNLVPVVACDGDALLLFKKEFPAIETILLPTYGIKYFSNFTLSMVFSIPSTLKGMYKEYQQINAYVKTHPQEILGLISDNRLGVYVKGLPSVYITHQLNIQAGVFSAWINKFHHYFINKHTACWIPDEPDSVFTGTLSKHQNIRARYIGILSRFKKKEVLKKYNLLVLLSGIEGQRKKLENLLLKELEHYKGKVLFVRGSFKKRKQETVTSDNIEIVDYLTSEALEMALLTSERVICRSGYSTVMDLVKLDKPALLIPTPGQTEQEYLATYLHQKNRFYACHQKDVTLNKMEQKKDVEGLCYKTNQHLLRQALLSFFKDTVS